MQPEWRGEEQVSCIRAQSISAMHRALPSRKPDPRQSARPLKPPFSERGPEKKRAKHIHWGVRFQQAALDGLVAG